MLEISKMFKDNKLFKKQSMQKVDNGAHYLRRNSIESQTGESYP